MSENLNHGSAEKKDVKPDFSVKLHELSNVKKVTG